jgi:succinate dehydrogenase/fumarate reductase flavoprotein subunit
MSYLNIDAQALNTYDAIVIGSGISGGWSAKNLRAKVSGRSFLSVVAMCVT